MVRVMSYENYRCKYVHVKYIRMYIYIDIIYRVYVNIWHKTALRKKEVESPHFSRTTVSNFLN
jgi:hypothetical protein